jgi:hypothetical protein
MRPFPLELSSKRLPRLTRQSFFRSMMRQAGNTAPLFPISSVSSHHERLSAGRFRTAAFHWSSRTRPRDVRSEGEGRGGSTPKRHTRQVIAIQSGSECAEETLKDTELKEIVHKLFEMVFVEKRGGLLRPTQNLFRGCEIRTRGD